MRRRDFIAGLSGAAAWPLVARAQHSTIPVVGFLGISTLDNTAPYLAALRRGLSEIGYIEGENVVIEARWAQGNYERLPMLAAELVERRVAVIVASPYAAALAAKAASTTIPIVFFVGVDPVKEGLVAKIGRAHV